MNILNFYDPAFVKNYRNMHIKMGKVEKYGLNPLFTEGFFESPPLPWEVRYDNGYPNVFYDEYCKKYRCYYTGVVVDKISSETLPEERAKGIPYRPLEDRVTALLYAESTDGLDWKKPALNLVELNGSKANNILMLYAHGSCVLLDKHEINPQKRYKLITRDDHFPRKLCTAYSEDGIHFSGLKKIPEYAYQMPGDTHNYVIWDEDLGKYILLTRMFSRELRTIGRSESRDFINWTPVREVFKGNGKDDQIYAMPFFKENGMYIGLPAIFHEGDMDLEHNECVDIELAFSGDSVHWERISSGTAFIPRGKGHYPTGEYDSGCCFSSAPVEKEDKYLFYYMGGNGTHYSWRETSLCMATVARGKLAGLSVLDNSKAGEVLSVMMQLNSSGLYLYAELDEEKDIRIQFLDRDRNPIEGYGFDNITLTKIGNKYELLKDMKKIDFCLQEFYLSIELKNGIVYSVEGDIDIHPIHPVY